MDNPIVSCFEITTLVGIQVYIDRQTDRQTWCKMMEIYLWPFNITEQPRWEYYPGETMGDEISLCAIISNHQ